MNLPLLLNIFAGEENGRHEWLVEFIKVPEDPDFFMEILDNTIKSLNSDYEAKRYKNYVLQSPHLQIVPSNTFYKWMGKRNKLGGQHKVPRLCNDRQYVEEILALLKESVNHGVSI